MKICFTEFGRARGCAAGTGCSQHRERELAGENQQGALSRQLLRLNPKGVKGFVDDLHHALDLFASRA